MGYFRNDDDEGDFEDADDYFNMELLELLGNNVLYRIHESDSEYSDFTEQSLLEMFDEYFSGFWNEKQNSVKSIYKNNHKAGQIYFYDTLMYKFMN